MVTGKTTVWQLCMGQWTMWKLGSRWNCDNAMLWSRAAGGECSLDSLDRKKPIICAAPPALAIIGLVSHRPGVGPSLSPCCRQLWWNVILALARHNSSLILVYLVTILDTHGHISSSSSLEVANPRSLLSVTTLSGSVQRDIASAEHLLASAAPHTAPATLSGFIRVK